MRQWRSDHENRYSLLFFCTLSGFMTANPPLVTRIDWLRTQCAPTTQSFGELLCVNLEFIAEINPSVDLRADDRRGEIVHLGQTPFHVTENRYANRPKTSKMWCILWHIRTHPRAFASARQSYKYMQRWWFNLLEARARRVPSFERRAQPTGEHGALEVHVRPSRKDFFFFWKW